MRNIDKLKKNIKAQAVEIRKARHEYREAQRAGKSSYRKLWDLQKLQKNYRHHHIAYCELRGKTRDEIEQPRDGNHPDECEINRIKTEYAWTPEEIVKYHEREARKHEDVRLTA